MIRFILMLGVLVLLMTGCANQNDVSHEVTDSRSLLDSDKDGVIDSRDTCPDTSVLLDVTNDGCPIWVEEKEVQELVIFFETSSSKVSDIYKDKLAEKVAFVKSHKGTSFLLEGFTSQTGSKELNEKLQTQRAESVKQALVSLGANEKSITIHTQGNFSDHVQVDESHIHNANQRVYIKIIKLDVKAQNKWSVMTNE